MPDIVFSPWRLFPASHSSDHQQGNCISPATFRQTDREEYHERDVPGAADAFLAHFRGALYVVAVLLAHNLRVKSPRWSTPSMTLP